MIPANLCFLLRDGQVCLAMKKRGFGAGLWNGAGGKKRPGETMRSAAVRELEEELGVIVDEAALEPAGTLEFRFADHPDWDTRVDVFRVRSWDGDPAESEEMAPRWFRTEDVPLAEMWTDDRFWLPQVLAGRDVEAAFTFSEAGTVIDDQQVRFL